jgi:hypothetical protein
MHKDAVINSKENRANAVWFLIEVVVYGVFVFAYYFLVLHFLGGWLKQLFDEHKASYAAIALTLMIIQGLGLQLLTGWLFQFIRGKGK